MIADRFEAILSGGVGDSFRLSVRIDVGVRAFSVAFGVRLFGELYAVFLDVSRAELAGRV